MLNGSANDLRLTFLREMSPPSEELTQGKSGKGGAGGSPPRPLSPTRPAKRAAEDEIEDVAVPKLQTEPEEQQGGEQEQQLDQQQQQGV